MNFLSLLSGAVLFFVSKEDGFIIFLESFKHKTGHIGALYVNLVMIQLGCECITNTGHHIEAIVIYVMLG